MIRGLELLVPITHAPLLGEGLEVESIAITNYLINHASVIQLL